MMMSTQANQFALIGQSFPMDAFKDLRSAGLLMRAERRVVRQTHETRQWRGSSEPIVVPPRLSA